MRPRADTLTRLARRSNGHRLIELPAPMSQAVREGRVVVVRNTAFFAASFAFQNSLDYARELMKYLDRFKRRSETRN